jgi:hypothetical protein
MRTWELLRHTSVQKVIDTLLWEFEQHTKHLYTHPQVWPPRKLIYVISIRCVSCPLLPRLHHSLY